MAITFPGTVSTNVQSDGSDEVAVSTHDPAACDLLLGIAGYNANRNLFSVTSDVDGAFTSIFESTRSGASGDAAVDIWGLLSPTDSNHTVTFDWGTAAGPNAAWCALINVSGVLTASLGDATNNTEEQVDDSGGTGLTFTGGGSSGNISLVAVSVIGDDADTTFAHDETETVLAEFDTGGGAGNNNDHSGYVAYAASPSSPAITWTPTDESAGLLLELVAAGASITPQAMYHLRNHGRI